MSEEAAFLEVLKANPADDTARLVYADWLDEHNEPAKAEYLRLVTRLSVRCGAIELNSRKARRVKELGQRLATEWTEAAAGRFDLLLLNNMKGLMPAAERIRELFGVNLYMAERIAGSRPIKLLILASFEVAVSYLSRLRVDSGMDLVAGRSGEGSSLATARFRVVAVYTLDSGPHIQPSDEDEARECLVRLVAETLDISLDSARHRITDYPVILADNLSLLPAKRVVERTRDFCIQESRFKIECRLIGDVSRST